MWENMSVSELAAIFKQVFRFKGEIEDCGACYRGGHLIYLPVTFYFI
jgi:hypothetical protein